ncbi:AT-hook motif nuclear-localized protein 14-like isoform X2 [Durio zibethinus]|uniref:AT-hook motif nuclear-localized protein n=1 Tax=Durio zibethinus TaxID=66656 RepID=A0A6P5YSK3_DURZI|nr:AT-hook motif nuclear-localized protein 14-like isoform X2 [Durio zibethinus]
MEPNETQQHYFTTVTSTTVTTSPSPTNGLLPPNESGGSHHMVYPHSVPSAVTSPLEPARRKRGRPRKYGTPEQALAAKKMASSSSKERREQQQQLALGGGGGSLSASSKKSQLVALGNAGQGFTPHVVNVVAGEDVSQKLMLFMQQSKREICILSASGTISNASLRQPATSGGIIAYEGRFEIISLSGSYVRTETGGRTGGLSVCLSSADGQIIGGGVGGPLKAAGPVQVIVGTFMIDNKDVSAGAKAFETSGRNSIGGTDDHQSFGGSHFMMQPQGMHVAPRASDWRTGLDDRIGFELTGKTGHGARQSPENGDYDQMAD